MDIMNRETKPKGHENASGITMPGAVFVSAITDREIPYTIGDRDTTLKILALVEEMAGDKRVDVLEKRVNSIEKKMAYYAGGVTVIVALIQWAPKYIRIAP